MTPRTGGRAGWLGTASLVLAAALVLAPGIAAGSADTAAQDVADVKAAFVYNFAKFTEWPALPPGAPIAVCVAGSNQIASTLRETIRGRNIDGHALVVSIPQDSTTWRGCHLLFITEAEAGRAAAGLAALKRLPVLTVSDSKGFATSGGIIELYLEDGKMRFAINAEAAGVAGLRISSRLLGLARIVRGGDVE
ncbi:MAG: YfiR family protein [Vicinamibacterales bacterium]